MRTLYPMHIVLLSDGYAGPAYIEKLLNTGRITLCIRITGDNTSVKIETSISEDLNVFTTNNF